MQALKIIVLLLVIIGGLNWGLVGAFDYNLVDELFGAGSGMARTIYILVGIAALFTIPHLFTSKDMMQSSYKTNKKR